MLTQVAGEPYGVSCNTSCAMVSTAGNQARGQPVAVRQPVMPIMHPPAGGIQSRQRRQGGVQPIRTA